MPGVRPRAHFSAGPAPSARLDPASRRNEFLARSHTTRPARPAQARIEARARDGSPRRLLIGIVPAPTRAVIWALWSLWGASRHHANGTRSGRLVTEAPSRQARHVAVMRAGLRRAADLGQSLPHRHRFTGRHDSACACPTTTGSRRSRRPTSETPLGGVRAAARLGQRCGDVLVAEGARGKPPTHADPSRARRTGLKATPPWPLPKISA